MSPRAEPKPAVRGSADRVDSAGVESGEPLTRQGDVTTIRGVKIRRLSWLGTRTERFDETRDFFADVLGLELVDQEPGFAMLRLPGGDHDYVEVFGADDPDVAFMTTGPVVGLLVDDVVEARSELESAGLEMLQPIRWSQQIEDYGWFQFRGPDGNVYGCMQGSRAVTD